MAKDVIAHMSRGEFLSFLTRGRHCGEGRTHQERQANRVAWLQAASELRDTAMTARGLTNTTAEAFHVANETEDWRRANDNDDDVFGFGSSRRSSPTVTQRTEQQRVDDILTLFEEVFMDGAFKAAPTATPEHAQIAARILTIAQDHPGKRLQLEDHVLSAPSLARYEQGEVYASIGRLIDGRFIEYDRGGYLKVLTNQLKHELEADRPQTTGHTINVHNSSIVASNFAQGSDHLNQQANWGMTVEQVTEALKTWLPEALKRIEADVSDSSDKVALKEALEAVAEEVARPKTRLEMLGGALRGAVNAGGRIVAKVGTDAVTKVAVAQLDHALKPWMQGVEDAIKGLGAG